MKKRLAAGAAVVALLAAGGTTAVVVTGDEAVAQAVDAFCAEFVPEIEQVPYHGKWLAQNPGERAQWEAFRDARCAGGEPEPPVLESHYGRALVAAGKRQPPEPPVTTTETTTTTVTEPPTTTDTTETTETTTTDTEPPPPPPSEGFSYPASFHIFGGNEATAMQTHDYVVASFFANGNPAAARANGNPTLVALSHSNLDPFHTDFCFRRGFALTYGAGLTGGTAGDLCAGKTFPAFAGANDALSPSPLGAIRPWASTDFGCTQADGKARGYALNKPATAALVGDASWYAWKLAKGLENGWNGVWSDNLIPSNLVHASWFYGSCADATFRAGWANGFVDVLDNRLRDRGVPVVGGNLSYRAATDAERSATQATLEETLEAYIAQGANSYANFLTQMLAWQDAQDGPSYCATMHIVPSTDAAGMRFGLALATIAGCAYMPYNGNHNSLYLPAEMTRNGQRHYLGRPTGDPVRSGNTWSRNFRDASGTTRTVTANYDTKTATFG